MAHGELDFTVGLWLIAHGRKGSGKSELVDKTRMLGFRLFANSQQLMVFRASETAERCPSWPKERDWKSRVPPKSGTVGSNPTLSAIFFTIPPGLIFGTAFGPVVFRVERPKSSLPRRRESRIPCKNWIPACAGMTEQGGWRVKSKDAEPSMILFRRRL